MSKIICAAGLALGLLVASGSQGQDGGRAECFQRCYTQRTALGDPEIQRQEIVALEREGAHAIQMNSSTFFRRVYSDDFTGTLSHGQPVNKAQWIAVIESPSVKYESFLATDIKVHIYQDTAVATCLWSTRSMIKAQLVSHQLRAIHVYVNTPSGWHVVSGQATNLPPDMAQPL